MIPLAELAALLGLPEEDYLEIVNEFIRATDEDVAGIRAGFAAGDAEQVRKRAHSIYGAAINLGFEELAGEARAIELAATAKQLSGLEKAFNHLLKCAEEVKGSMPA